MNAKATLKVLALTLLAGLTMVGTAGAAGVTVYEKDFDCPLLDIAGFCTSFRKISSTRRCGWGSAFCC